VRIAIIGAGLTGLTAAYNLAKTGHKVTIFEKESFAGGLAAGFKEKGWQWPLEHFYHHFFPSDTAVKNLLSELGLSEKLFFARPKTSIYYKGKICQFDSPFSLLRFPYLSPLEKIRTGLVTAYLKLKTPPGWNDWELEKAPAALWLSRFYGKKAYEVLWQPLLESKFGDQAKEISMAWFWARIKKRSARLGYLEDGFQVLIDKLVEKIKESGGKFYLNQTICSNDLNHDNRFERVLFATPTCPFQPADKKLPKMRGALNLILVLKKTFLTDGTYWLNINEKNFPFVAVAEHTNFIDKKYYGDNFILYVGGYYPQDHRYFRLTKEEILTEFLPYLQRINPQFNIPLHTTYYILHTNKCAQPIIPVNYSKIVPSFKTKNPHVFWASMLHVYPWDRGTNYAIELGEKVANEISKP
jgi:protoporphyrinogen oxidase